jgi:hypothetical protein
MDQYGGVSFRKGCFIGQEVVSRMQHRGTARRRIMIAQSDVPLPEQRTEIAADGKTAGQLISVGGNIGLALVRTDRIGEAVNGAGEIFAADSPVSLHFPEWAKLTLPAASEGEDA